MKLAKFKAFLHHVINKHTDLQTDYSMPVHMKTSEPPGSGCTEVHYNFNSGTLFSQNNNNNNNNKIPIIIIIIIIIIIRVWMHRCIKIIIILTVEHYFIK